MGEFSIILSEEDSIITSGPSPIVDTPFCVSLNGKYFPDNDWTDYSFPVLCMWTESVLRNRGKQRTNYTLSFMDGPYKIEILQNQENILLQGINGRKNDRVEYTAQSTVHDLIHELLCAFKVLNKIVNSRIDSIDPSTTRIILDAIQYYACNLGGTGDGSLSQPETNEN